MTARILVVEDERAIQLALSGLLRREGFAEQLFDAEGRVHGFVNLFVNGEEIGREALDTALDAGDRVEILAAIAGG